VTPGHDRENAVSLLVRQRNRVRRQETHEIGEKATWAALGARYAALIDARAEDSAEVRAKSAELLRGVDDPGEALRRLTDLRARIVGGSADFAEMARVHSSDATAARGGELDWVYAGDTVPDFERAYQELKVGEISQPVRTPFGYHLIQVLERRAADMSPERRRLQARQALRERKADEAYQEWLRQLRDQIYVELRLEER